MGPLLVLVEGQGEGVCVGEKRRGVLAGVVGALGLLWGCWGWQTFVLGKGRLEGGGLGKRSSGWVGEE